MSISFRRKPFWGTLSAAAIVIAGARYLPLFAQEDPNPKAASVLTKPIAPTRPEEPGTEVRVAQSPSEPVEPTAQNPQPVDATRSSKSNLLPLLQPTIGLSRLPSEMVLGFQLVERSDSIDSEMAQLIEQFGLASVKGEKENITEKRSRIREIVKKQFQEIEARRSQEIEALETRLNQLKSIMTIRSENADRIIDRRVQQLVGEKDVLDWNADSISQTERQPSPASLASKLKEKSQRTLLPLERLANRSSSMPKTKGVESSAVPSAKSESKKKDSEWLVPGYEQQTLANELAEAKVNLGNIGVGMAGVYLSSQDASQAFAASQTRYLEAQRRLDSLKDVTKALEEAGADKQLESYRERLNAAQKEFAEYQKQLEREQTSMQESQRLVAEGEKTMQEYQAKILALESILSQLKKQVQGVPTTIPPVDSPTVNGTHPVSPTKP